ncbi:Uu.00g119160.m01.CDS01 [Anthostomella pinea]|uniref:Uu.00g119160.m01.CDS01 n=1 Tax=Anthostomella pinea TaxID=933095 RepID=A0AAI8VBB2_9PEZI|nr:Uu.00g119160.m01.CDS01 [Anthostomella pinea]
MGKDKSKAAAKKSQPASTPPAATAKPPSWPPFRPALPVTQLEFDAPVPGFQDQIVLLHNFFPKSLCRDYVTFLKDLPLTTTPGRPKRGEATRVNDRFQIHDPAFSQRLWLQTGLKEAVLEESVKHLW